MVAIVDYCAGNLRNITRVLDHLGIKNFITDNPQELKKAKAVIVPGVGSAGSAMKSLQASGMDEALREFVKSGKLYLGICLGLQLLFEYSEEDNIECLGILKGRVKKLQNAPRIPEIGWNNVQFKFDRPTDLKDSKKPLRSASNAQKLFAGIPNNTDFYHLHSYVTSPIDSNIVIAESEYGEIFPAAVAQENILGVQFHPEKSGNWGIKLMENFGKIVNTVNN